MSIRLACLLPLTLVLLGSAESDNEIAEDSRYHHLPLELVPEAARKAIKQESAGAEVGLVRHDVRRSVEPDDLYTARWESKGVTHEVRTTKGGVVLLKSRTVEPEAVPDAIRTTVKRVLRGEPERPKYEKMTITLYKVSSGTEGEAREMLVSPTGGIWNNLGVKNDWAATRVERVVRTMEGIRLLDQRIQIFRFESEEYPRILRDLLEKPMDAMYAKRWKGPYVENASVLLDGWGNPYRYRVPGLHNVDSCDIWSIGPDGIHDTADDIGNWYAKGDEDPWGDRP